MEMCNPDFVHRASRHQEQTRREEPTSLSIIYSAPISTVSHTSALSDVDHEHREWEPRQTGSYAQPQPRGQGTTLNISPRRSQEIVILKRIGLLGNEHKGQSSKKSGGIQYDTFDKTRRHV